MTTVQRPVSRLETRHAGLALALPLLLLGVAGCDGKPRPTVPPQPAQPVAPSADPATPVADDTPATTPPREPDADAPMDEAARLERFFASPEDPPAEKLLGVTVDRYGKHYLAGNEKGLHVYREHIKGIGGGYVGVGSDQAYLLMGWARPEWAWLIDYDPMVVRIHDAYQAFILTADTPAEFVALWKKEAKSQGLQILREHYEGARLAEVAELYKKNRTWIHRRLSGVAKRQRRLEVPSFLTDQADYDAVKALVRAKRVRPMSANLLEAGAVQGIGAAAREMEVPIRVLYLSNAEEYWKSYPQAFRDNIQSLPFDDRSLVIRCLLTWQENEDYWYNLQPARNFSAWLDQPWFNQVYEMAKRPKLGESEERPEWWLVVTDEPPLEPAVKPASE